MFGKVLSGALLCMIALNCSASVSTSREHDVAQFKDIGRRATKTVNIPLQKIFSFQILEEMFGEKRASKLSNTTVLLTFIIDPEKIQLDPSCVTSVEKIIPDSIESEKQMECDWSLTKRSVNDFFQKAFDEGRINDDDWDAIRDISAIIDVLANEFKEDAITGLATVEGYLDFMNLKSPVIKEGLSTVIEPLKNITEGVYKGVYEKIDERLKA